jgi:acyl-CoA synthetase (AMP-forming)/AMP-acid ligase II
MTSLWKLWEAAADRCATKTVVIDADTGCEWTCHELTTLAERIAAPLNGRIVPICQPNSAFWLAAFLGVQKIGAAALPLDPSLRRKRKKERCAMPPEDCLRVLVASSSLRARPAS